MIRFGDLEEVLPLRVEVLRGGRHDISARNAEDALPDTFHVVYVQGGEVLGVASLHPVVLAGYEGKGYQLRGMAVKPNHQQNGIGKQMLIFAEAELRRRAVRYIWCNARQAAFGFYEKMGYHYLSELFEIPFIGPHKKMLKYL